MQRVIIRIQSNVYAEAVQMALSTGGDFRVAVVERDEDVAKMAYTFAATAVLMDVTDYLPNTLKKRLEIRDEVKRKCPQCKIVLLIDETSCEKAAEQVRQAKKDGAIDQFIYTSVSASYLAGIIDTL